MRTHFRCSVCIAPLPLKRSRPYSRSMAQYEQQDATPSPTRHSLRSRILVVDDGDWVRNIIGLFLEHAGFEVCGEATDGVEGIEQAKKLKPDLIVLDLAMPRMNGAEAASVLSTTMPDIPIVLLTLYQNVLGNALASAVGVKAIIDKTDGLDKLVASVRSLLDRSTSEPSPAH
jgi:DNA-binding NarL/FixJ family response regulator